MVKIEYIVISAACYFLIGTVMVVWDFRKVLFRFGQTRTEDYLNEPLFLEALIVRTALLFILTWPFKFLRKRS